jgi:peptide/nickel transport system substrate-binding protein
MSRALSTRRLASALALLAAGAMTVTACSTPAGTSSAGNSAPSASAGSTSGTSSGASGSSGSASGSSASNAGTSASGAATGGSGGTLVVALAQAPDDLDPTTAQTFVGRIVFANMCEKLYDVDKNLNIIPQLAADLPQISNDGKTVTIKLRTGVKFNDGTDFNADAVKTTLERDKTDKQSSRASELADVTAVDVVDPSTVKLTLKEPYAPLTAILADRAGMIESPAQLKKMGDKFGQDPVCVGPFSFKSRPSSDEINLVKSQYYYDKDKVKLDAVTFQAVTQPNVRATNLRSGDINVAGRLAPPDIKALQGVSNVKLQQVTSLGYQGISINVSNGNGAGNAPFDLVSTPLAQHQELRQAFALTLDRDAINKVVFNGQYVPDCTPISPDSPFYPKGLTCPKPDIAKAKQLVAASGVSTPIKVTLVVEAANDQAAKLGQVVQGMAKQAGFDVTVAPTEFTTALSQAQAGKFDTFQVGWSGRIDPDQNIQPFWDPASALNYTGANYPDITDLIKQAEQTSDTAQRQQLYQQLCEKFLQENNIIYLYHEKYTLGVGSNVSGVQYFGDGLIRLTTASIS